MTTRILIDLTSYSPTYKGGVSTYVKGLVNGLKEISNNSTISLLVFADTDIPWLINFDSTITVIRIKQTAPKFVRILHVINYRVFKSTILLTGIQILSYKNLIWRLSGKSNVIYTPTTYANFPAFNSKLMVSMHDIQEKRYPEFFTRSQKIYRDLNVRNTLKHASHIQVSSHFVKEEIKKYYPKETFKTFFEVIPEGVSLLSSGVQSEKLNEIRQDSVILPASFHPHKNQVILLDVFKHLKSQIKICATGDVAIHERQEEFQILTRKNNFYLLGFVNEEELEAIYRESLIVLSTSLYESSSLPLLEGISKGCIPVASDIPAHREMALNLTIFLFDPKNPAELATTLDKIAKLSNKELREIRQRNSEALRKYSWQSIATKYVEVLSRI